jgi:ABC-type amino acid transport system permease subunit
MTYHFSGGFILDYWSALLIGSATTLKRRAICVCLGMLLGFALSLMRTSGNRLIHTIGSIYVEFFRGMPVLIQIFLDLLLSADRAACRYRQSALGDHRA